MPGLIEEPAVAVVEHKEPTFMIGRQSVTLEIDPYTRRIEGATDIEIVPLTEELKTVQLNCRQAKITRVRWKPKQLLSTPADYTDAYEAMNVPFVTTAHQHEQLKRKLPDSEFPTVELKKPSTISIVEIPSYNSGKAPEKKKERLEKSFDIIHVYIDFMVENARDGLHFVGWELDDLRYPHFYTQTTGTASVASLFPCVDSVEARYFWDISIKTPKTIGDAINRHVQGEGSPAWRKLQSMSETDKALDLSVMCSGNLTDEIVDPQDATKKTSSFRLEQQVAARHIGFAVGPFEEVNLAAFRDSDEDDRLGRNAVPLHAFCLPGRTAEVKNTCFPLAKAMDYFAVEYTQFPFTSFKLCFVDDLLVNHSNTASLSICSNEILFTEEIIDPLYDTTRELVFALASQWSGIYLTPEIPDDLWVIIGIAYFMTDCFLRKIFGNNEYRYQQKLAAQKVCEKDVAVPPISRCGRYVSLDRFYYDFIALKAPVVLFILDRRLVKLNASYGLSRMISKVMRDDTKGRLSTSAFEKLCERLGHTKLESFFSQWVYGEGCPKFRIVQRFNKKKLVVEMSIDQEQTNVIQDETIEAGEFMREVKEYSKGVFATGVQPCFVGPMTIRIHEADGTPYEHIVEIKEPHMKFEIPYNTKYKRLKRSRRQREKVMTGVIEDPAAEGADDVLLYCLGEILGTEEEKEEWHLSDWSKEDQEKMNQESYEWIRMDADFEWICELTINMPGYMYVSQLQQDRDVVAQLDTVRFLMQHKPHPLISTFLIRTLMDGRYFHGVRTAAAAALCAQSVGNDGGNGLFHLCKAFQELFCLRDSSMTSPNDFTDRAKYMVQLAIVGAIAGVRDSSNRSPFRARRFLYEVLHYNDNGENEYSDCFYISTLIKGLAEAVASAPLRETEDLMSIDDGDDYEFLKSCWQEIERYQRRDGWIPSYHNIVSVTALYAKFVLDKADSTPKIRTEYLYFTQPGNHENVRIAALGYLFDLGFGLSDPFLKYFFSIFVSERSPRTRVKLMNILTKFVGAIAIGEYKQTDEVAVENDDLGGLVVEQAIPTAERKMELERKTTVEGASAGLKQDLGNNLVFMACIWEAVLSPRITVDEFADLLTLCSKLYGAQESVILTVRYPRWIKFDSFEKIPPTSSGQKTKLLVKFKPGGIRKQRKPPRWRSKKAMATDNHTATANGLIRQNSDTTIKQEDVKPRKTLLKLKTGTLSNGPSRQSSTGGQGTQTNTSTSTSGPAPSGGGFKIRLKVGPKSTSNGSNGTNGMAKSP